MGQLRVRMRKGLPRYHAYVAANHGTMACSECGVLLNEREIKAVRRGRLVEPLCFACQGYSRELIKIDIDGPEVRA